LRWQKSGEEGLETTEFLERKEVKYCFDIMPQMYMMSFLDRRSSYAAQLYAKSWTGQASLEGVTNGQSDQFVLYMFQSLWSTKDLMINVY
jgi:hypothetical protein